MSHSYTIEQPEGHRTIHVWADPDDQIWACCAYDHGPFCRLCQRVDETLAALLQNCEEGNLLARAQANGEFEFKHTTKGKAMVENLISTNVEIADMWARLQARGSSDA